MNTNNWEVFNFILSENINTKMNEQLFESKVIQAFGELGWKDFLGNIEVRPTLHIGSVNRIEPDLLFKSDSKENLFVVEVKRPGIDLNSDHQKQLFSYMRQLKLDYGILIGNRIQIFYDGALSKDMNPILLETIKFKSGNERGLNFVELFYKENFSFENLNGYTSNQLSKLLKESQVEKLKEIIYSPNFITDLEGMIKNHFENDFDENVIETAFKNVLLQIKEKPDLNNPTNRIHIKKTTEIENNNFPKRGERLNIELNPSDRKEFKNKLLANKGAWITTFYRDGRSHKDFWNAQNITESSNVLGNLRSRPNFRNGKWQQLGIKKVLVSIY